MLYTLIIKGAPNISQGSQTALSFATAALARNHRIVNVFFYQAGVLHGSDLVVIGQDESSSIDAWVQLSKSHNIPLSICITGAMRRGVLDATEAQRYDRSHHNVIPPFRIAGLGDLMAAIEQSDRCLNFGRSVG